MRNWRHNCRPNRCWASTNRRRSKARRKSPGCGHSSPALIPSLRCEPRGPPRCLQDLLTDAFDGVVNCDRAKMYWNVGRPQWCWAHLKRDFQALIDHPDHQVKRLGRDLMRPTKELFRHWARCRDGTITRRGYVRLMQPIRQEIDGLLLRGVFSGNSKLAGNVRPAVRSSRLVVDVPGRRRSRADQQRQRASLASSRDLAEAVVRHSKCPRQPLRGDDSHGRRNLP